MEIECRSNLLYVKQVYPFDAEFVRRFREWEEFVPWIKSIRRKFGVKSYQYTDKGRIGAEWVGLLKITPGKPNVADDLLKKLHG